MTSSEKWDFPQWIADCPDLSGLPAALLGHRLSTALSFSLVCILAAFLSVLVYIRYNSVVMFDERIRTPGISNTMWMLFYASAALTAACNTLYVSLGLENSVLSEVTEMLGLVLHTVTVLYASLSLAHQIRYRSPSRSDADIRERYTLQGGTPVTNGSGETKPLIGTRVPLRQALRPTIPEAVSLVAFVQVLVIVFLKLTYLYNTWWFFYVFLSGLALQILPLFIMAVIVLAQKGPKVPAKCFLAFGTLVLCLLPAPVHTWGLIMPDACIPDIHIISYFDLLVFACFVPLGCFFGFLRSEYERHKAECMYQFVRQTRDTFVYRPF